MPEDFVEEHREEIEQIAIISGTSFDSVVDALNRAMDILTDVFKKLAEAVKAICDALCEFIPDRWKELCDAINGECEYEPPPKCPRPPKKNYVNYVAPVISHNFRRVQHRG